MNRFRNFGITFLAGALLFAGFASSAQALTNACTQISNQASLTYKVGGIDQPSITSDGDGGTAGNQATTFNVATKVDLTVAITNSPVTATGAGSTTNNVMTFSITNTGNDTQRYGLRLWAAATGYDTGSYTDEFDMGNATVYVDTDNDLSNGFTTQIGPVAATDGTHLGYTPDIAGNNGVIYVHVVGDVPAGRVSGDNAIYALQAITHQTAALNGSDGAGGSVAGGETDESANTANTCSSAVVLADNDADGAGSFTGTSGNLTDAARNGDSYAVGVYVVATAAITVSKSFTVEEDPINGVTNPKAIPGARIRYTVTVTNGSTTPATSLELTDQIPANTDFFVGSVSAPGGATVTYSNDGGTTYAYSPTAGGNGADPTVTHVMVNGFNLAASSNVSITFDVIIE